MESNGPGGKMTANKKPFQRDIVHSDRLNFRLLKAKKLKLRTFPVITSQSVDGIKCASWSYVERLYYVG